MAEDRRRGRSSRPDARSGPGRPRRARPNGSSSRTPARQTGRRPKFTGRAAILVLVLAILTVSYASSLRAYLTQREQLQDLNAEIESTREGIRALEREKRRWEDPAFVESQARERLDYVMPGEVSYVVIGEDGEPLTGGATLAEPVEGTAPEETDAWWDTAWASVVAAGEPERVAAEEQSDEPADEIEAPPAQEDQ